MILFGVDQKMQAKIQDDTPALVTAALEDPVAFGRLYDMPTH